MERFILALVSKDYLLTNFIGPKNNWNIYYKAYEALGTFYQQNKLNLGPGLDDGSNGLYLEETFKEDMIKRSKYLDDIKIDVTTDRLRRN